MPPKRLLFGKMISSSLYPSLKLVDRRTVLLSSISISQNKRTVPLSSYFSAFYYSATKLSQSSFTKATNWGLSIPKNNLCFSLDSSGVTGIGRAPCRGMQKRYVPIEVEIYRFSCRFSFAPEGEITMLWGVME